MIIYSNSLYYISLDDIRGKSPRGRHQVLPKLHVTKRSSKVNRRPGRKPGFHSNVHGSNTRTCRMGKLKQHTGAGVKDFGQEVSSCVIPSSCRVGITLSTGEEVVRRIHL
jgi:hypothetical protein